LHVSKEYFDYIIGQLAGVKELDNRKMFGGYGLYSEGVMFGLIAENRFHLKTDESNRDDYEAVGMEPFMPHLPPSQDERLLRCPITRYLLMWLKLSRSLLVGPIRA
jgi:hypothetical protein